MIRKVTARSITACQARDDTIAEVFERAAGSRVRAHTNPAVLQLCERSAVACDCVPLISLPESSNRFASFAPFRTALDPLSKEPLLARSDNSLRRNSSLTYVSRQQRIA
jgi:hypothetical protein